MDLNEILESRIKHTVGYREAKDKQLFMVGANVGLSIATSHFEIEIENLKKLNESYKKSYDFAINDLQNLASIIQRYTYEE